MSFKIGDGCDFNVPVRAVHYSVANCEPAWEYDQEFVKWKKVQVLDPVLSIIYDWVKIINVRNGKRFQEGTKRQKLTGLSGLVFFCIKGYYEEILKTDTHFSQILVPCDSRE